MHDIKLKIRETRDQFRELVWPLWAARLNAAELVSVEGSERPFEQRADRSGIDAFFARRADEIIIPLASRIEYATSNDIEISRRLARRFTVRSQKMDHDGWHKNTELRRLLTASKDEISRRYLPYRTFHTLLSKDKSEVLFSSSVCTQQFCDYIVDQLSRGKLVEKLTKDRDAKFVEFFVEDLVLAKVDVETIP